MDPADSLRQTVTHLFDAVRYGNYAKELERLAKDAEDTLETELSKLDSRTEELSNVFSSMEEDGEEAVKDLAKQMEGFLEAAKNQARQKLEKKAKQLLKEYRSTAATERDKALKSLEAYLASEPLPVIERTVSVKLSDGIYVSQLRCECEGGIKYTFGLSAQNSGLFHEEFTLSQLGHELRVPVRFSKPLLGKNRVPGFERLDQYPLVEAETSGTKVRATFDRPGNGAKIKVVTSGTGDGSFVGVEYTDQTHTVNVMNDPALSAHTDLKAIQKAMADMVRELGELSQKKVALLKLATNGERSSEDLDCEAILKVVLKVLGPKYRQVMSSLSKEAAGPKALSVEFIKERMKVLGDSSDRIAESIGVPSVA